MWGTRNLGRDIVCEGVAQEAFTREAGEQREAEGVERVEVGEQGEVLVECLAEAEAGIEDDGVATDACGERCFTAGAEFAEDERQ